jgi:hypothetical protein
MRWYDLDPDRGVLELDTSNEVAKGELEIELAVWWGGGAPTRAVWLWSQSGKVAAWAWVGQA